MRGILDIEHPPKDTLFNCRKVRDKPGVNDPEPDSPKNDSEGCPSEDLRDSVIPQIHPREHSQNCQNPGHENCSPPVPPCQQAEVDSEEEHVLGMT